MFSFCRSDENVYTKNDSLDILIFIQLVFKFRLSRQRIFRTTISFFRRSFLFLETDSEFETDVRFDD